MTNEEIKKMKALQEENEKLNIYVDDLQTQEKDLAGELDNYRNENWSLKQKLNVANEKLADQLETLRNRGKFIDFVCEKFPAAVKQYLEFEEK